MNATTLSVADLQQLWHYDASYPYDTAADEYTEWHTTDPYYLQEDVSMMQSFPHAALMVNSVFNLKAPAQRRGLDPRQAVSVNLRQTFLPYLPQARPLSDQAIEALSELPAFGHLSEARLRWLWQRYLPYVPEGVWEKIQARSYVEPDVGLLRRGRFDPQATTMPWTPDNTPVLVLEVISVGTADKDVWVNPQLYGLMGVQEYWICDPEAQRVTHSWQSTTHSPWDNILAERALGADEEMAGPKAWESWGDDAPATGDVAFSPVLDTWVNLDVVAGFQCWDRERREWITGDPLVKNAQIEAQTQQIAAQAEYIAAQAEQRKQVRIQSLRSLVESWSVVLPEEVEAALRTQPLDTIPTLADLLDVQWNCTADTLHDRISAFLREAAGLPASCPPQ